MTEELKTATIPEDVLQEIRIEGIFSPSTRKQREELFRTQTDGLDYYKELRFVHYTTAEAALKIITGKRLWMRNSNCMADYREVQHGFTIFNRFFSDQSKRKEFDDAIDSFAPGASQEAIALFNSWWS